MKQFVLKTPTVLLILGVLLPLIASVLILGDLLPFLQNESVLLVFNIIQVTTICLWFLSIHDFFSQEKDDMRNKTLIQSVVGLFFILTLYSIWNEAWLIKLAILLLAIVFVVLIIKKVKAVFYERSTWFIVLELILVPVGIFTLTEEIKNCEAEKTSEEKELI